MALTAKQKSDFNILNDAAQNGTDVKFKNKSTGEVFTSKVRKGGNGSFYFDEPGSSAQQKGAKGDNLSYPIKPDEFFIEKP